MIESKKVEEKENIIKIAGKGIEVYNQVIINSFKYNEEVELQVNDSYRGSAEYIIKEWEALGILPSNGLPIRFTKKEQLITKKDKNTFNGIINSITLKRPPIRYPPEKLIKINLFKGEVKDNIVWIATRNIEVYTQFVLDKFQCNNQVEIQVKRAYKDNAIDIIKEFGDVGIFPENGLPIKFEPKEVDIKNLDGELTKEKILSITLTKLPEIYKFTKDNL